jgi:DMSO/TMAO reductase YedYZ molybdopterin-dependent catalytic subunit
MGLYVVRHQHDAERCPAADPDMGAMLLNHLSRPNVRRMGVEIQGEAIVSGEHTMFLIAEAADEGRLREFMAPFAGTGSVDIYPASTCVRAVASGGCAAPLPEVEGRGEVVDPEEACAGAIEAGLVVHRAHPLNCETSLPALLGGVVMPNAHFYVRNHFHTPDLDSASWRLSVVGLVARPLSLGLRELRNLPSQSMVLTLECAGNGRSLMERPADGEQWGLGAVSTAEWTGVPLAEVMERVGVRPGAREVLFRGADGGPVEGQQLRFERSLPLADALDSGALLAYAMNGEPLPVQHGYPLRLVVPGWYSVASVKWLSEIEVIDYEYSGFYQGHKYVYEWEREGEIVREPVTLQQVKSLVTEPVAGAEVDRGEVTVRGVAWSGAAAIASVEVSANDGPWERARLMGERTPGSWQWWEASLRLQEPGDVVLRSRATDRAGRTQPVVAEWNRLGYGNNAIYGVPIRVR